MGDLEVAPRWHHRSADPRSRRQRPSSSPAGSSEAICGPSGPWQRGGCRPCRCRTAPRTGPLARSDHRHRDPHQRHRAGSASALASPFRARALEGDHRRHRRRISYSIAMACPFTPREYPTMGVQAGSRLTARNAVGNSHSEVPAPCFRQGIRFRSRGGRQDVDPGQRRARRRRRLAGGNRVPWKGEEVAA